LRRLRDVVSRFAMICFPSWSLGKSCRRYLRLQVVKLVAVVIFVAS